MVSGALLCKKHEEEEGKRKEESGGEQKQLSECVQRESEHTHTKTHTPEGRGHSQNAAEVQRGPAATGTPRSAFKTVKNKTLTPPNDRTRLVRKLCRTREGAEPSCRAEVRGWERVKSTTTASSGETKSRLTSAAEPVSMFTEK